PPTSTIRPRSSSCSRTTSSASPTRARSWSRRSASPCSTRSATSWGSTRTSSTSEGSTEERSVGHGNRTRQRRLSSPLAGFEDRAGHQARRPYRDASLWALRHRCPLLLAFADVHRPTKGERTPSAGRGTWAYVDVFRPVALRLKCCACGPHAYTKI